MSAPAADAPADSFGVPWGGRTLNPHPFAGDAGAPDAALIAALAALDRDRQNGSLADVVAALAAARVYVPLVAVLGEGHPLPDHVRGDAGAEMNLALLTGPDGRRALPVFTGLDTLTRWDAAARPVPVEGRRAALSAAAEDCSALVLDVAGPVAVVVPRAAVWAIGKGRDWVPAASDPEVHQAVEAAARRVRHVRRVRCEAGSRSQLAVVLGVAAGLTGADLDGVLDEVQRRLAADETVAERVDSLELRVLPA